MKSIIKLYAIFLFAFNSFSQDNVEWLSFEEAISLNQKNPKPILISIYTDWCGWCKKMDLYTYSNQLIYSYINNNFYAVKLDGEEKNRITFNNKVFNFKPKGKRGNHELAVGLMDNKIVFPTTVIMSENEVILDRIPGYLDASIMEKFLVYFNSKAYKTKNWDDFNGDFKSKLAN